MGLWTLGRVYAMVSAVKCVNLAIHRPILLGLIIHYMSIKNNLKKMGVLDCPFSQPSSAKQEYVETSSQCDLIFFLRTSREPCFSLDGFLVLTIVAN